MPRSKRKKKGAAAEFLKRAQIHGFYMDLEKKWAVEFIRPLRGPWIRVRTVKDGLKYNALMDDLQELNEMEVLAHMVDDTPEEVRGKEG
jgi:hypothetical protein